MIFSSCLFQDVKNNIFFFRWNVKKVVERAQEWSLILNVNNVEKEKKNLQELYWFKWPPCTQN
jgi:hypothetical protein